MGIVNLYNLYTSKFNIVNSISLVLFILPMYTQAFGYPFVDREESDKVLSELEERIKAWHAAAWDGRSKTSKPKAVKMNRVSMEVSI